jgi:hypothetical protein
MKLLIQGDKDVFLAELVGPGAENALEKISQGCKVRISGINTMEVDETWNYGLNSFNGSGAKSACGWSPGQ